MPAGVDRGEDLWQKAVAVLDPSCKANLDLAKTAKLDVLKHVLEQAEGKHRLSLKERWRIKRPGGDDIIVRDVLEKIILWIKRFRDIGDIAVQYDPTYASLPWAAIRFVLQAAINETEQYNGMVVDLELATRLIARFREFESLYLKDYTNLRKQLERALVGLYASILEFLAKAVSFFQRSTVKRVLTSPFHTVDEETRNTILRKESEILKLADLVHAQRLLNVEKQITRLSIHSEESQKQVDETKHAEMLAWLSTVPYGSHHRDHTETRIPGTGDWLLQNPQYQGWVSSSSPSVLLLHGIPGCGKTSLCSVVIDRHTQSLATNKVPAPTAYFYCSAAESEPERHTSEGVIRSLARQLSMSSFAKSSTPKYSVHAAVSTMFEEKSAVAKAEGFKIARPRTSECIDIILEVLQSDPANIVIDAIDEIEDPDAVLNALNEIARQSRNVLKVFLTSRNNSRISALLPHAVKVRITLNDNREDVRRFSVQEVDRSIADAKLLLGHVDDHLRHAIVNALASGAGEMFLWSKLQLSRLCLYKLEDDVRKALPDLAQSTVDELYQATYERILDAGEVAQEVATRTFAWLLYVCDPLSPDVFLSAISSPYRWKQPELAHIIDVCHNFIYLDTQLNIIRFAHQSVQEFLRRQPIFSPRCAQQVLALSCISVCSEGPLEDITKLEPTQRVYDYAALYWGHHCSAIESPGESNPLQAVIEDFLFDEDEPGVFATIWLETIKATKNLLAPDHPQRVSMDAVASASLTPLFPICIFGMTGLLEHRQWPHGFDWNQRNDTGQTALYLASYFGHRDVVSHLLNRGVDVNVEGGKYGSPLHCAAFRGHSEVTKLLLHSGADAHAGSAFETVIHAACRGDNEKTALVLFKSGLEIEDRDTFESILRAAAEAGFAELMTFLHGHRLSRHITPRGLSSACTNTIKSGKVHALQCLLRKKSPKDTLAPEALAISGLHGHDKMTKYLLEQGFDIEAAGHLGTPLRCASLNGHFAVVRILLDHGAAVDGQTDLGTALHAAAMKGHTHIARLLLSAGADVNAAGGSFGNSLQAAAFHGHEDMVELLIKSGANVHNPAQAKNAVHAAVEGGSYHILKLFVRHDLWLTPGWNMFYDLKPEIYDYNNITSIPPIPQIPHVYVPPQLVQEDGKHITSSNGYVPDTERLAQSEEDKVGESSFRARRVQDQTPKPKLEEQLPRSMIDGTRRAKIGRNELGGLDSEREAQHDTNDDPNHVMSEAAPAIDTRQFRLDRMGPISLRDASSDDNTTRISPDDEYIFAKDDDDSHMEMEILPPVPMIKRNTRRTYRKLNRRKNSQSTSIRPSRNSLTLTEAIPSSSSSAQRYSAVEISPSSSQLSERRRERRPLSISYDKEYPSSLSKNDGRPPLWIPTPGTSASTDYNLDSERVSYRMLPKTARSLSANQSSSPPAILPVLSNVVSPSRRSDSTSDYTVEVPQPSGISASSSNISIAPQATSRVLRACTVAVEEPRSILSSPGSVSPQRSHDSYATRTAHVRKLPLEVSSPSYDASDPRTRSRSGSPPRGGQPELQPHPLQTAAALGHLDIIDLFCEDSFRFNIDNQTLERALISAVCNGQNKAVDKLLTWAGADFTDDAKFISHAAENGQTGTMNLLFDRMSVETPLITLYQRLLRNFQGSRGALKNVLQHMLQSDNKEAPAPTLHLILDDCIVTAASKGYKEVLQMIANHGHKPKTDTFMLAFARACDAGKVATASFLYEWSGYNVIDPQGLSHYMFRAHDDCHIELFFFLVTIAGKYILTPSAPNMLLLAAGNGCLVELKFMIDGDQMNDSLVLLQALNLAARQGHDEVCKYLLSRNVDPTVKVERISTRDVSKTLCRQMGVKKKAYGGGMHVEDADPFEGEALSKASALESCISGFRQDYRKDPHAGRGWRRGTATSRSRVVSLLLESGDNPATALSTRVMLHAVKTCPPVTIASLLEKGGRFDTAKCKRVALSSLISRPNQAVEVLQLLCDAGTADELAEKDFRALVDATSQRTIDSSRDDEDMHIDDPERLRKIFTEGHGAMIKILLNLKASEGVELNMDPEILQLASAAGDFDLVETLVSRKVRVEGTRGPYGSALIAACISGQLRIVRLLAGEGAPLDAVKSVHGTALEVAINTRHKDIIGFLIEQGADVEHAASHQSLGFEEERSLLAAACAVPGIDSSLIEALIVAGSSTLKRLDTGASMPIAIRKKRLDLIRLLLKYGYIVSADVTKKLHPLHVAIATGDESVIELLLEQLPTSSDADLKSMILQSIYENRKGVLKILLDHGAASYDSSCHTEFLKTAYSKRPCNVEMLELVIESVSQAGFMQTACSAALSTPENGTITSLLVLLEYVCCPSDLFFKACMFGIDEIVQVALEHGLEPLSEDVQGRPALQLAAAHGYPSTFELLLSHGADVNSEHPVFGTPLRSALEGWRRFDLPDSDKLTEDRTVHIRSPHYHLFPLSETKTLPDYEELVTLLLSRGALANTKPGPFGTALHLAAFLGEQTCFDSLISAGADPHSRGGVFDTVLRAAASGRNPRLCEHVLRLDEAADVSKRFSSQQFSEALHAACGGRRDDALVALLDHGADPNLRDAEGRTAFEAYLWSEEEMTDGHWRNSIRRLASAGESFEVSERDLVKLFEEWEERFGKGRTFWATLRHMLAMIPKGNRGARGMIEGALRGEGRT